MLEIDLRGILLACPFNYQKEDAQGIMTTNSDREGLKKREKVQNYFWNTVGAAEHINIPKLEGALKKEFNTTDDRIIQTQIKLMQTEAKIRVQNNAKVWIKQPKAL